MRYFAFLLYFESLGGRLGSFSPCIEQVQKTSEVLRSLGYVQITTLECFQKELTVLDRTTPTLSFNWVRFQYR